MWEVRSINGHPILVTGMHRSGTTWVGKTLAQAPRTYYIHEPFNLETRPLWFETPMPHMYQYVDSKSDSHFGEEMARILNLQPRHLLTRNEVGMPNHLRLLKRSCLMSSARLRRMRPIVKDPIAFFSAPWLDETFSMDVVVCVRHPAACVSSLARLGWYFDVNCWLDQPHLLSQIGARYADEIARFAASRHRYDLIAAGTLVWKVIYGTLISLIPEHPSWIIVRQEDLAESPREEFRQLFASLGLEYYTERVAASIVAYENIEPTNADMGPSIVLRNSRSTIDEWKGVLSQARVEEILGSVEPEFRYFYPA